MHCRDQADDRKGCGFTEKGISCFLKHKLLQKHESDKTKRSVNSYGQFLAHQNLKSYISSELVTILHEKLNGSGKDLAQVDRHDLAWMVLFIDIIRRPDAMLIRKAVSCGFGKTKSESTDVSRDAVHQIRELDAHNGNLSMLLLSTLA